MFQKIRRSRQHESANSHQSEGFALVATLMLLILITIVALGMLTLASVELRKGGNETARLRAEANARMSLQLAVSELQKTAGPDQRVTARAEIDGSPNHRNWLGVWRSTRKTTTGEGPVVRWDDRDLVLVDSRTANNVSADDLFEGWLVSQGDTLSPDNPGSDLAVLVGPGSVNSPDREVQAPLSNIQDAAGNLGAYAYWVSDESLKASVNVPASETEAASPIIQPGRYGFHKLDQLASTEAATSDDLAKVIDFKQASLISTASIKSWKTHYHSIGARSLAVLSDPVRGGLKQDLSSFFETPTIPAKGPLLTAVSLSTPILGGSRRRSHGPKMGSLREFAGLADKSSPSGIAPSAATFAASHDKFSLVPSMNQPTSQAIHPVLACAEIYTRFAYVRGYLTVHLYPRIVLWNPYNTTLQASNYTVDFNQSINDSMVVEKRQQSTTDVVSTAYDTRSNKDNRASFTLEATSFEPGEALVFSPKPGGNAISGRATPLALRSSGSNVLSTSVDPSLLTNFYLTITQLSNKGVSASDLPLYGNHNRGAYYWVDMMDWWEGNPDNGLKVSLHLGSASSHSDRMRLPLLQIVDTDNWKRAYQGRYNNGRWRVGGVEPIENYELTPDLEPWSRGCYGFRYKWWVEKNPYNYSGTSSQRFWQAAVTADYNLRAAFCHRSPFDSGTDNGESHHWYIWGPYAVESQQGLPALSPERAAHKSNGKYRGNPFFGGSDTRGDHVYPLFDIPKYGERIVSMGRFQHAQLTPFLWHPTYAIGGSWVPPNQTVREKSGDPAALVSAAWTDQMPFLPLWMKQDRSRDEVVYDLSYESNHELWDRYFLSGATAAEKKQFATDPGLAPLPNSRLIAGTGTPDPTRLIDYHQAGSEVMLAGAFNVNSTEPDAWRALFSSLRDKANSEKGTDFPRFIDPISKESNPTDIYQPTAWTGIRSLDDARITALANAVVDEVKKRGPFLSVSDFVNRRLVSATAPKAETGLSGTLQTAIERSGLNDIFNGGDLAVSTSGYGVGTYEVGSDRSHWASPDHLRESKGAGMPTYLQQGDLLQALGSSLVARGDTFVIRSYGEARSPDGKSVLARAWCEAEVQRMPDYVNSTDPPEQPAYSPTGAVNPAISAESRKFGRRFNIVSFRWLSPGEV
jgi:type II secretory pathway pseudopilin PulG